MNIHIHTHMLKYHDDNDIMTQQKIIFRVLAQFLFIRLMQQQQSNEMETNKLLTL